MTKIGVSNPERFGTDEQRVSNLENLLNEIDQVLFSGRVFQVGSTPTCQIQSFASLTLLCFKFSFFCVGCSRAAILWEQWSSGRSKCTCHGRIFT
jgi:hypothetical protein